MAIGPHDVHLDLAAGVAAEPRAVLYQENTRPVPGRTDRTAETAVEQVVRDVDLSRRVVAREGKCSGASTRKIIRIVSPAE